MTWGTLYMYYRCPRCSMLFKYGIDLISEYGAEFGFCPNCNVMGEYITEGARIPNDLEYENID